jgi:hypothetical protein
MTEAVARIVAQLDDLSLQERAELAQIVLRSLELERESEATIEPGRSYPLPSPDRAFTAAAALLGALEEAKNKP